MKFNFNFQAVKTFFQRLFPFFKKQVPVVPTNPVPEPVKAPTVDVAVVQATPVATTPPPTILAPSTQAYEGGGTQVTPQPYSGQVNDIHGLVIEHSGEPKWFGAGVTKYIMPKVEAGKTYTLSVADAAGRVDVKVSYSDTTDVPGASFTAINSLTQAFTVNRNDDLTVEVLSGSPQGTIERHDA